MAHMQAAAVGCTTVQCAESLGIGTLSLHQAAASASQGGGGHNGFDRKLKRATYCPPVACMFERAHHPLERILSLLEPLPETLSVEYSHFGSQARNATDKVLTEASRSLNKRPASDRELKVATDTDASNMS